MMPHMARPRPVSRLPDVLCSLREILRRPMIPQTSPGILASSGAGQDRTPRTTLAMANPLVRGFSIGSAGKRGGSTGINAPPKGFHRNVRTAS
jgi:hypothetical protein